MKDGEESKGRSEEPKSDHEPSQPNLDRRSFLRVGALAAGARRWHRSPPARSPTLPALRTLARSAAITTIRPASIARLQALMSSHRLSAQELLEIYLRRVQLIDKGLDLSSVYGIESRRAAHRRVRSIRERRDGHARAAARHPDPAQGQHRHRATE